MDAYSTYVDCIWQKLYIADINVTLYQIFTYVSLIRCWCY